MLQKENDTEENLKTLQDNITRIPDQIGYKWPKIEVIGFLWRRPSPMEEFLQINKFEN